MILSALYGCRDDRNNEIRVSESDLHQAERAFAELKEALEKDNGRLWNHRLDGPILLINKDTRIIIANEQDAKGELVRQGDCFIGKFPDAMIIAHSAIDWNGKRWATYTFPLPEDKTERLNGLIHESFHRIQPEIGFDSLFQIQCGHLDTREGRIYLKLEIEALKKALRSEEPLTHIKNALFFREYRYQLFPEAKAAENSLEINEGLAQYTSTVLLGLTPGDLKDYYQSQMDILYSSPTFVRSFAYFVLPVYGYFMKQTDEYWNSDITRKTNLTDYMLAFYKIQPTLINQEAIEQAGKNYGSDSIIKVEETRELERLAQSERYRRIFLGDSTLTIRLEKMQIGFNPGNLVPLDSFGTVYPNLTITDNWGILQVDSCGALVSTGWDEVRISYPLTITDSLVIGNGWKLKINPPWKLEKKGSGYVMTKK